ncbi:Crp/Fnr family transcriptional regulator [Kitasatospora sp. YST-16]|uniref:Crp/Fnr family transcriptional regulator n=1 Tax=Kitasatospora sp. YST-16 TaxID=2998080 RepID=UPI0022846D93|nr:Crp/Fnr family transcriptional regulator [Kitasatospora sp. YST-16]WAL73023.1 Crp/Fnr family transcriptional regulator [Kitasatospora sp. YST-16]WNW39074.1 Crp/Fnr family transcriptional regulator [Streptomyces sp. Li-HN-5-13]
MSADPPPTGGAARPPGSEERRPLGVDWPAGSYLGLLSEPSRQALMRAGRVSVHAAGETIVREGERTSHLFLIEQGLVKVTSTTREGHVSLLAIRAAGDVVGELAAIDGAPRSATVTAVGTVRARAVRHSEFVRLFREQPQIALALVAAVAGKLRAATRARVDTGGYPLQVRLARVLVELAETYGEPAGNGVAITVPLSQEDLAAIISSSMAGVTRSLQQLRRNGLIDTSYRRLTVLDLDALSDLAVLPHLAEDASTGLSQGTSRDTQD